jgi:hypothetical protein
MLINLTTTELWIEKSSKIMKEKKINIIQLNKTFENIYFPWTSNYDLYRNYYSLRIQQRPLFIIQVINIKEIETILDYVYKKNLKIRICTGRHSTQLLSPDVLVDMSLMNNIDLKKDALIVQGGCTQGQCNEYLFEKIGKNHYSNFGHWTYGRTGAFAGGSAQTVTENLVDTQAQENLLSITTKQMIYAANGVYLGFPMTYTDIPFKNEVYYGKSFNKLEEIKNIYDPEQVLSYSGTL